MLLSMTVVPFYDPYFRKSLFSAPTHTQTDPQTDIEFLAALAILTISSAVQKEASAFLYMLHICEKGKDKVNKYIYILSLLS